MPKKLFDNLIHNKNNEFSNMDNWELRKFNYLLKRAVASNYLQSNRIPSTRIRLKIN